MGFLPILLPFLEAVTGKRINSGGPKRPFQKTDEFGGRRPKKKTDKCAPKPDFPGRPPCVYSGVLLEQPAWVPEFARPCPCRYTCFVRSVARRADCRTGNLPRVSRISGRIVTVHRLVMVLVLHRQTERGDDFHVAEGACIAQRRSTGRRADTGTDDDGREQGARL